MYTITVRYSKNGLIAYDLNGDNLSVAQSKAKFFKSQGFYVEVCDAQGVVVLVDREH